MTNWKQPARWLYRVPLLLLRALARPPVWLWSAIVYLLGSFRFWLALILTVLLTLIAYHTLADAYTPITTDAFVQAYVVQIAPQIGGQVVRVHVREAERVRVGTLLYEIDPRPFELKIAQLEARLVEEITRVQQLTTTKQAAEEEEKRLRAEADYAANIHQQELAIWKKLATTERKYLEARDRDRAARAALAKASVHVRHVEESLASRLGDEHAYVARAKADLAEARLNLSFTRVVAPCDGIITDLQLREGAFVHVGQSAMTLIDTTTFQIVGNFRENALRNVKVGMPALLALRGMPGQLLPCRVSALGWGVQSGQGVPSGTLPLVKREASWVQPAQRFQGRFVLEHSSDSLALRVGMTGSVSIYVEEEHQLNEVTRGLHQLVAWLYFL